MNKNIILFISLLLFFTFSFVSNKRAVSLADAVRRAASNVDMNHLLRSLLPLDAFTDINDEHCYKSTVQGDGGALTAAQSSIKGVSTIEAGRGECQTTKVAEQLGDWMNKDYYNALSQDHKDILVEAVQDLAFDKFLKDQKIHIAIVGNNNTAWILTTFFTTHKKKLGFLRWEKSLVSAEFNSTTPTYVMVMISSCDLSICCRTDGVILSTKEDSPADGSTYFDHSSSSLQSLIDLVIQI